MESLSRVQGVVSSAFMRGAPCRGRVKGRLQCSRAGQWLCHQLMEMPCARRSATDQAFERCSIRFSPWAEFGEDSFNVQACKRCAAAMGSFYSR